MYILKDVKLLVMSAFFDIFSIQEAGSSYTLKTRPSVIHSGRRAMDLALDGDVLLALLTLIE